MDFYLVLVFPFAEDEHFTSFQDMFEFPLTYTWTWCQEIFFVPTGQKLAKIYFSSTIAKILLNPRIKLLLSFIPLFDRLYTAINIRLQMTGTFERSISFCFPAFFCKYANIYFCYLFIKCVILPTPLLSNLNAGSQDFQPSLTKVFKMWIFFLRKCYIFTPPMEHLFLN